MMVVGTILIFFLLKYSPNIISFRVTENFSNLRLDLTGKGRTIGFKDRIWLMEGVV